MQQMQLRLISLATLLKLIGRVMVQQELRYHIATGMMQ